MPSRFQLTIVNGHWNMMVSAELSRYLHNGHRTSEGMVIASRESGVAIRTPKAPLCTGSGHGEAVTEGLLRGAFHRKKTDSHGCCSASE